MRIGPQTILELELRIPRHGVAKGSVIADAAELLTGTQTLIIGNLSLVGTVERAAVVDGRAVYDWTAGAGGWGREITIARCYESSIGVLRNTVIAELAADLGETTRAEADDTRLPGKKYLRPLSTAERPITGKDALYALGALWWVAPDGATVIGQRSGVEGTGDATFAGWEPDHGFVDLIPNDDDFLSWMPGNTYRGEVIEEVVILSNDGRANLHLSMISAGDAADLGSSLRRMITGVVRGLTAHHGCFEYRVTTTEGATTFLDPTDARNPFGPIPRALQFVAPGMHAELRNQSRALVSFRNAFGDAVITSAQPLDETNGVPIKTRLYSDRLELGDATDLQLVARKDDLVNLGTIAWAFTPAAPPAVPTGNWVWTFTDASGAVITWTLAGILPGFTLAPPVQPATPIQGKILTPSQGKVFA